MSRWWAAPIDRTEGGRSRVRAERKREAREARGGREARKRAGQAIGPIGPDQEREGERERGKKVLADLGRGAVGYGGEKSAWSDRISRCGRVQTSVSVQQRSIRRAARGSRRFLTLGTTDRTLFDCRLRIVRAGSWRYPPCRRSPIFPVRIASTFTASTVTTRGMSMYGPGRLQILAGTRRLGQQQRILGEGIEPHSEDHTRQLGPYPGGMG